MVITYTKRVVHDTLLKTAKISFKSKNEREIYGDFKYITQESYILLNRPSKAIRYNFNDNLHSRRLCSMITRGLSKFFESLVGSSLRYSPNHYSGSPA